MCLKCAGQVPCKCWCPTRVQQKDETHFTRAFCPIIVEYVCLKCAGQVLCKCSCPTRVHHKDETHFTHVFCPIIAEYVNHDILFLFFFKQKMLRAFGLFAGSIFLTRNFGELMAI